jgi:hypothetical protein
MIGFPLIVKLSRRGSAVVGVPPWNSTLPASGRDLEDVVARPGHRGPLSAPLVTNPPDYVVRRRNG